MEKDGGHLRGWMWMAGSLWQISPLERMWIVNISEYHPKMQGLQMALSNLPIPALVSPHRANCCAAIPEARWS